VRQLRLQLVADQRLERRRRRCRRERQERLRSRDVERCVDRRQLAGRSLGEGLRDLRRDVDARRFAAGRQVGAHLDRERPRIRLLRANERRQVDARAERRRQAPIAARERVDQLDRKTVRGHAHLQRCEVRALRDGRELGHVRRVDVDLQAARAERRALQVEIDGEDG
jgi:hypothetical protein